MTIISTLSAYKDDRGNEIIYTGKISKEIFIKFTGSNNRLVIADGAKVSKLTVLFDCDNGFCEVGENLRYGSLKAIIRIGQDSSVIIGDDVSSTGHFTVSATEGSSVRIGDDVMMATGNDFRADDGHPIFDIHTEMRVNPARDIIIGDHVWLATDAVVLGGGSVADGSVIGYRSLVTGEIPNNVVAVGSPARVVRKDTAWERPHLSLTKPYFKPDASTVKKSEHWNPTESDRPSGRRAKY